MELDPNLVAREVATALAAELGRPDLPSNVEAVLREGVGDDVKLDGVTMLSLAALTVAAAQLAWAIYSGLTGKGARTEVAMRDELGRRLKIQTDAPPESIDKIVGHVTKALFKQRP